MAQSHFKIENVGDVLVDYAETRFWCYDDEGYAAQALDVHLGILYSVDMFGVRDPQLAYECWEAALDGPYPEGAQEDFTKIEHLLDREMRARLALLCGHCTGGFRGSPGKAVRSANRAMVGSWPRVKPARCLCQVD